MISHYLKLAQKALLKNTYYTFINVFGLVFGMLSALVIAKYVGGSLQFDSFHLKKDSIYSIMQEESTNGNPAQRSSTSYWGVGELINQHPDAINMTRYSYHVESLIIADDGNGNEVSFVENNIFTADSSFLNVFTFPLVHGDPKTALSRVNSIVLTQSSSEKYFGTVNPIGKILSVRTPWGQETSYNVTGVVADPPKQSQFKFHFLTSHQPLPIEEFWTVPSCSIYILLTGEPTPELAKSLTHTLNEVAELKSTNRQVTISLTPFSNIELSRLEYLLAAVGIFIILISWVNYINQVIAQSYMRTKEIGILRVLGATRTNLKTQFIVESSLICLSSLILIVVIYFYAEPYLQTFTDGHLLPLVNDPTPINFIFLTIFIVGVILAAAIPTVILFAPDFGTTLRNVYGSKIGSVGLRKALVIFQFSISTILMISIFVISNQLAFMKSKDKGIAMENILIIKAPMSKDSTWGSKRKTLELFKAKCAALPFVIGASSSTTVPGEEYRQETYLSIQDNNDKSLVHQSGVDEHFLDLYGVKFIAGHNFIPDARFKNRSSIIINESAAKALGIVDFDKMINSKIVDHESNEAYDLIGIIQDYHQTSLKYEMRPLAFRFNEFRGHISLRLHNTGLTGTAWEEKLLAVKQIWQQVYHDAYFDTFLLDEKFAAQDAEDRYFGKLFEYCTILSIVISCLGLFGLSLLISTKRQKEIGVRKVFGASSADILGTFLKGYLGSLLISVLIGSPVAYFLMTIWLRSYAYRIEIGWGLVSAAMLSLTLIFLFTVSYHTIKSSLANPVNVLRD